MSGVAGRNKLEELGDPRGVVGGCVCGQDRVILDRGSIKKERMSGERETHLEHQTCFVQRVADKL